MESLERDSFLHSNQDSDIYVAYCAGIEVVNVYDKYA